MNRLAHHYVLTGLAAAGMLLPMSHARLTEQEVPMSKVWLITGSSRGIGRGIALKLSSIIPILPIRRQPRIARRDRRT